MQNVQYHCVLLSHLRSNVSTVSFLDRMLLRIRAFELPFPIAARRFFMPVPLNLSFLQQGTRHASAHRRGRRHAWRFCVMDITQRYPLRDDLAINDLTTIQTVVIALVVLHLNTHTCGTHTHTTQQRAKQITANTISRFDRIGVVMIQWEWSKSSEIGHDPFGIPYPWLNGFATLLTLLRFLQIHATPYCIGLEEVTGYYSPVPIKPPITRFVTAPSISLGFRTPEKQRPKRSVLSFEPRDTGTSGWICSPTGLGEHCPVST